MNENINGTSALALVPKQQISISMPSIPTMAEVESINAMCKIAAYSGFLSSTSKDIVQRSADAFFVVMYGRELGIPPMTALKTIHVIDGKPSCSGQALLSLMLRAGVQVDMPDPGTINTSATVTVTRPGGRPKNYTYTEAMAQDAGIAGKNNWRKHKREMLLWRAVSTAARFEVPDIVGGLYTVEELNPDLAVDELGAPVVTINTPPAPPQIAPEQPQTGVSDKHDTSHQNGEKSPENPPSAPNSGNPVSNENANSGGWVLGAVMNEVIVNQKLVSGKPHFDNLIKKLEGEGKISATSTNQEVIAVIEAHYADKAKPAPTPAATPTNAFEAQVMSVFKSTTGKLRFKPVNTHYADFEVDFHAVKTMLIDHIEYVAFLNDLALGRFTPFHEGELANLIVTGTLDTAGGTTVTGLAPMEVAESDPLALTEPSAAASNDADYLIADRPATDKDYGDVPF